MKKLMIAAAVAMLGIAANASNYVWGINDGEIITPGGTEGEDFLEGGYCMLLLGTVGQTAVEGGKYTLDFSGVTAQLTGGWQNPDPDFNFGNFDVGAPTTENANLVTQPSQDNTSGTQAYTLLLLDTDEYTTYESLAAAIADGNEVKYFISQDESKYAYNPSGEGEQLAAFIDKDSHVAGDTWRTATNAVPEPTSGLLLLLGVAGLALRRRRA